MSDTTPQQGPAEPERVLTLDEKLGRSINRDRAQTLQLLSEVKASVYRQGEYDQDDLVALQFDDVAALLDVLWLLFAHVQEQESAAHNMEVTQRPEDEFARPVGTGMTPVANDDPRLPDANLGAELYKKNHPHDHGIVRRLP